MKTIVWDVDDVLNDLLRNWLDSAWLRESPDCPVGYDQLCENPPHRVLGISLEEYLRSIDAFRRERGAHLVPNREQAAGTWAAWVTGHFGRWIRSFNFIPSHRPGENLPVFDQTKGEYLRQWARVDAIVEDNPANIESGRAHRIPAVAVPPPGNGASGTLADALRALSDL